VTWQRIYLTFARRLAHRKLQTPANPTSDLLVQCWGQLPSAKNNRFLAVDLETSSLSTKEGEILSAGWVALENNEILLATAEHHLISAKETVGQSATIHHLRDCDLEAAGSDAEHMFQALLRAANGRILLFHNANLDMAFLNQLSLTLCGSKLLLPFEDTLLKEKQKLEARDTVIGQGDLTLGQCRSRYHLPYYAGHNALNDALATAELFQAQQAFARGRKLVN